MKKLLTAAAAMALVLTTGACSKTETPTTPTSPSSTSSSTSSSSTSSETSSQTPSVSVTTSAAPTDTGSVAAPPVGVNQTSPEGVMTSWLNAMLTGDSKNVCALMASGGQAIEDIPNAVKTCGDTVAPMLESVKSLGEMFKGLTISGATVNGDNATFDNATTTPAMAATIIKQFKAVKIKGKWYVTQ